MRSHRGYTLATLPAELAKFTYWPSVDATAFEAEDLHRFNNIRLVVERYLSGCKVRSLLEDLNLTYEELHRALRRCVTRHADGLVFGWRALIPGIRVKEYTRQRPIRVKEGGQRGGYAGALQQFFRQYPTVKEDFDTYLRTRTPVGGGRESRVTQRSAHGYFIELAKKAGTRDYQWPLCTRQLGKAAVRAYVLRFFDEHYDEIVEAQYGTDAKTKSQTGTGHKSRLLATFPYDVVEVDEHKAHFIGSIGIPTPSGIRYMPICRVILLTVTDRRSGTVLGYHAVFRREATAEDILIAVHNALQRWTPRELSLTGPEYDERAGFPSGRLDCLAGCGWGSLLLDNALIHLADDVLGRLRDLVGCDVNFGPPGHPERRPIAELVFKRVSQQGFTRVESTTGSDVTDPIRQEPEVKACKTRLDMEAVLDLVELAIAHYNGYVSGRVHGVSGLDFVEQVALDDQLGFLLPRLPTRLEHVAPLNIMVVRATVSGERKSGVRPRIYALNDYYTSPEMAQRWDLLGAEIRLHVNPADVRTVIPFTEDGAMLGVLRCREEWGDEPCSLDARREIAALIKAGQLPVQEGESYVRAFLRALQERAAAAAKGKKPKVSAAATRLAEESRKRGRASEPVLGAANDSAPTTPSQIKKKIEYATSDVYEGPPLVLPTLKAVN